MQNIDLDAANKEHMLILNTNMVRFLNGFANPKISKYTVKFKPYTLIEHIMGSSYVHALIFENETDRDEAIEILKEYKDIVKLDYPFFYKAEKISKEDITVLDDNAGDFRLWGEYVD